MKLSLLLVSAIFLANCCGVPQIPKLELPPKVNCQKLNDAELTSVSGKTYEKLANLYISCVENDKTLRAVIRATH